MHEMTPLQAWSKCCISAYVCRRPHKIHIFGAGANRTNSGKTAAPVRRQQRGPSAPARWRFLQKKATACERVVGRRSNVGPSRLVSAVAAASCYA